MNYGNRASEASTLTPDGLTSRALRSALPGVLRTERLVLRPVDPSDSEALWSYRRMPDIGRWLGWHPSGVGDWEAGFATRSDHMLVVEREGRIIGDLMVRVCDAWAQREAPPDVSRTEAELGWAFAPDAGGRGYATEAVRGALGVCFTRLNLRRVHAEAFLANESSWRLMERVGMRREALTKLSSLHREYGWMDGVSYALLSTEWRSSEA